jgi:hypothetical protein
MRCVDGERERVDGAAAHRAATSLRSAVAIEAIANSTARYTMDMTTTTQLCCMARYPKIRTSKPTKMINRSHSVNK